jgi:hypothetical protein
MKHGRLHQPTGKVRAGGRGSATHEEFSAEHRSNAIIHTARRAFQRYGLVVTPTDIEALSEAAKTSDVVAEGKGGRTLHRLTFRGRTVFPLFCPHLGCIVTFLPGPSLLMRGKHTPHQN